MTESWKGKPKCCAPDSRESEGSNESLWSMCTSASSKMERLNRCMQQKQESSERLLTSLMPGSSFAAKYPDNALCQKSEESPSATEVVPSLPGERCRAKGRSGFVTNHGTASLHDLSVFTWLTASQLVGRFHWSISCSPESFTTSRVSVLIYAFIKLRIDKEVGFGAATKSVRAKSRRGGRGGSPSSPAYLDKWSYINTKQ